jgi:hypothetical protein
LILSGRVFKPRIITDWSSYHEQVAEKEVIFFTYAFANSREYPGIIWEIAHQSVLANARLTLVWMYHSDVQVNRHSIKEIVQTRETADKEIDFLRTIARNTDSKFIEISIDNSASHNLEIRLEEQKELDRSIDSIWMSRNLKTLKSRVNSKTHSKLYEYDLEQYFRGRRAVNEVLVENNYDIGLIPNGRFPLQVGLKHGLQRGASKYLFWERGFRRTNKVFLQEFQTQDLESMNLYFLALQNAASERERTVWQKWASEWLTRQKSDEEFNPFLIKGFDSGREPTETLKADRKKTPLAPIFTSSLDERLSNLPRDLNGWKSQTQAIGAVADLLSNLGMRPYVRLHPNLGWKSFRELIETVRELKEVDIEIQLPWEGPSTYALMESAACVVTWGSTVSLESTARGISTINLGKTRFDKLVDIFVLDANSETLDRNIFDNEPNRGKSLEAIYLTRNYGLVLGPYALEINRESTQITAGTLKRRYDVISALISQARSSFLNTSPFLLFKILEKLLGTRLATYAMRVLIRNLVRMPNGFFGNQKLFINQNV